MSNENNIRSPHHYIFVFDFDHTLTYEHSGGTFDREPFYINENPNCNTQTQNEYITEDKFTKIFSYEIIKGNITNIIYNKKLFYDSFKITEYSSTYENAVKNLKEFFENVIHGKEKLNCIFYINSRGIRRKIVKFLQLVDYYIIKKELYDNKKYTFNYCFDNYKNIYGSTDKEDSMFDIKKFNSEIEEILKQENEKDKTKSSKKKTKKKKTKKNETKKNETKKTYTQIKKLCNGDIDIISKPDINIPWPEYKSIYLQHFMNINNYIIPKDNVYFFDDTKENITTAIKKGFTNSFIVGKKINISGATVYTNPQNNIMSDINCSIIEKEVLEYDEKTNMPLICLGFVNKKLKKIYEALPKDVDKSKIKYDKNSYNFCDTSYINDGELQVIPFDKHKLLVELFVQ
jgi:hypothetical protein